MVKICDSNYPSDLNELYSNYFEKYPFELSSFQKYSIESIVNGNHVLVTAHTGSGKTLPAEFAIQYFVSQGKKVIYTSPIKALSNQKFHEFTLKFPSISFGILTGDIKTNPEADVLIMTTEILMNSLYTKSSTTENKMFVAPLFEMDFQNELACVIFDEVHYINDVDRGHVWESCIMMLPQHVQMVMLSATIDSPEKFAKWVEDQHPNSGKNVYLASTYERVVPLTHYAFITCTQGLFKVLKDKDLELQIMKNTNNLHVIQDAKGNFMEQNYYNLNKYLNIFEQKNHFVKRQHVLNTVTRYMVDNNMLPAICFVLSRKALEQCAKEVTTVLLEDDSKVPYTIRRECEQIIRKLPNYQEYLNLPEYNTVVSLLEKGIAIHHAGIMPVLREMVELMFSKGFVKLLFATETFAVGINMPTKTVLFTDINKYDGSGMRSLLSHEYTQMAGRAGRRGIDTVGHVIHLPNLYSECNSVILKTMLKGKPQLLTSKFKISYNLLLNLIKLGETDYYKYVKKSMIQNDIEKELNGYQIELTNYVSEKEKLEKSFSFGKIPFEKAKEYTALSEQKKVSVNKKRKDIERQLTTLENNFPNIDKRVNEVNKILKIDEEIYKLNSQISCTIGLLEHEINIVLSMLEQNGFIQINNDTKSSNNNTRFILTNKGQIASSIREVHCLTFAEMIDNNMFTNLGSEELVSILSCFTNVSVSEDKRSLNPTIDNKHVLETIEYIEQKYKYWSNLELKHNISTGTDYKMNYDLISYIYEWTNCTSETECKALLNKLSLEKDVFLGEFVKALLKINNVVSEFEKIAEQIGDMALLSILKEVQEKTLKFVATNQSLYVNFHL
jgi:superfamily II RNA helicase